MNAIVTPEVTSGCSRVSVAPCLAHISGDWCDTCRYYNAAVHQAAFALPQFAVTELASSLSQS